MTRSKKAAVVAVTAGVLALGAGVGVASIASANPTPTPTASPSSSTATQDPNDDHPGHGGFGGHRGAFGGNLAKTLATKLGVSEARVTAALQAAREENRPTTRTTPGAEGDRATRDAALAKSLAQKLGVDEAKVTKALSEIRATRDADRAAALKIRLDAAVKAGTLTQAEADAVTKAVQKGVINPGGGPR